METSEDERRALVLNDDEVLSLARWAVTIEDHYEKPMDMEWAKDGEAGELFSAAAPSSRPRPIRREVYVMCEIPANVILARDFAARLDGSSIGSNDLTQLVLGVDRDSDRLAHLFDERNDAVRQMIGSVVADAHACERKVGLCGQAPSDHPDFAAFLVRAGIDSISVNPDSFLSVKQAAAEIEQAAHLLVGQAREGQVRLLDRNKGPRSAQMDDAVGNIFDTPERLGRDHGDCDHQLHRPLRCNRAGSNLQADPGRGAVVNQQDATPGHRQRRFVVPMQILAALQASTLILGNSIDLLIWKR